MPHYRFLDAVKRQDTWLTIGVFDGLHRGHRVLLQHLVDGARAAHPVGHPVVLTFYPHPAVVLGGQSDFVYLSLPDEKAALLEEMGIETVITIPFDLNLAAETAQAFMQRVSTHLGLRHLLIGHDFALGRGRDGDAARLAEIGRHLGYTVEVLPAVHAQDLVISSTAIRNLIQRGQVAAAAALLGRPYAVSGPVVHGDGRGRHINIPTANIAYPAEKLVPAHGIYATWALVAGVRHPSATNIGINPTFTPERQGASLETHLLDFQGDLYGQTVQIEFVERLRDEMKFPSVEALIAQIRSDIQLARKILGDRPGG
ncbi:MAG: bifunctional riboflavin kinase/FAD synthetase [Anaerolineales bacterium]|nr:bifunctional riboflavin kinase/FAD synthetase [Anaerolineales bacterium]